jgi:hypothetical protein
LIETANGEQSAKDVEAIVLAFRTARAYWMKKGGGKKPPNCSSTDGIHGVGDPGGECSQCPYAKFGSATHADGSQGAGIACKEMRELLVLLPNETLPHRFSTPPPSVSKFGQYQFMLVSKQVPLWGAISKLSLERATSAGGIDYSRVRFRLGLQLRLPLQRILDPYRRRMAALFMPSAVDATAQEID